MSMATYIYFLLRNSSVHIILFNLKKIENLYRVEKKDKRGNVHKTGTLGWKLRPRKQRPYERFTSTTF